MERPKKNNLFLKVFHAIDKIELVTGAIALTGLFLTVIVQIITRVIGIPLSWTEEATRYFFLWMMWIALAGGFNYGESARVMVLVNLVPDAVKIFLKWIYVIVNIGFFGFILKSGYDLVMQQFSMNEMGTAIHIPMAWIGACTPVAGALGIIGVIGSVFVVSKKLTGQEEVGGEES